MIMFTHTFVRLILDGLQGIKKSICHCTTGNQKSGLSDQDSVEKRRTFCWVYGDPDKRPLPSFYHFSRACLPSLLKFMAANIT